MVSIAHSLSSPMTCHVAALCCSYAVLRNSECSNVGNVRVLVQAFPSLYRYLNFSMLILPKTRGDSGGGRPPGRYIDFMGKLIMSLNGDCLELRGHGALTNLGPLP